MFSDAQQETHSTAPTRHVQGETHVRRALSAEIQQVPRQPCGEESADGVDSNTNPSVEVVESSGSTCISVDTVHGLIDKPLFCAIRPEGCCETLVSDTL